jgi:hypothetical protein
MKLTIIVEDAAVYKDGINFLELVWEGTPLDVHALQWIDAAGWIEYKTNAPNDPITELPEWANNALAAWQAAYDAAVNPPPPAPPSAEANQATAAGLLQQTDWTTIADVGNPQMSNPYLANQAEFITYRNEVRQYAVYPVEGDIVWPVVPTENWIKV